MLQFKNQTPLPGTIFLLPDPEGVDSLLTVVKGTFTLKGKVIVADEQVPITLEEKYHGDPGSSSVQLPSDVGLAKPSTDILMVGHAYSAGSRPTPMVDVSLAVGAVRKMVRVTGDRTWRATAGGAEMSHPEPFVKVPLVWERAFGGSDRNAKGPVTEPRNPLGAGFRLENGERPLNGLRLPNLEDPAAPISTWKDRPPPACFAPVAPHWEPRRSFAGTYDERWQQERAPFLPTDFDTRFLHLAPPGLVAANFLQGSEAVEVRGASPSGLLRFPLPGVRVRITYLLGRSPQVRPANLDTLIIEPDASRIVLVWRAVLQCDKQALRVTEVRAELENAA